MEFLVAVALALAGLGFLLPGHPVLVQVFGGLMLVFSLLNAWDAWTRLQGTSQK